jgi:DUF1680 family protein
MTQTTATGTSKSVTPVAPTTVEHLVARPFGLDQVRITNGFWADWQRDNRAITIPHSLSWIEKDGALDAFRRVASGNSLSAAERPGLWFSDSDVYKTLEGLAWELGVAPSAEIERAIDDITATIAAAQGDDGYINTFVQEGNGQRWTNLGWSHEMYCMGHLIQAAVAHKRSTGRDELLTVAVKAADCLVADFGDEARPELDGHPEIEMALIELYRVTGTTAYLDLAQQLIDLRGHGKIDINGHFDSAYYQDETPVREETTTVGHAVRAVYLLCGVVDLYLETGEQALLESAERQWSAMTSTKTYVNGAIGSRIESEAFGDPFELPQDLVYGETCATIGAVMLSWRLLLATGESRYADAIERGLFNLVAASTSVTRDAFFYSNPAQRRVARPAAPVGERPRRSEAPGTRPSWFVCTCCPPNILRTIASLSAYVATTDSEGIQLHQYIPAVIDTKFSEESVRLKVESCYPDDGAVRIQVEESGLEPWTLSLRVPEWAGAISVSVNGSSVDLPVSPLGYVEVNRGWAAGDVVDVSLPVEPRFTVAHPQADAVRGQVALERGAVVYCFESPDQPEVDLNRIDVRVDRPVSEETRTILGQSVVVLRVSGVERDENGWTDRAWAPVDGAPPASGREVELMAVPYHLWANRGPSMMRIYAPARRD